MRHACTFDLWNMRLNTYRPDGLRHSVQGKVHIRDNGNIIADIGYDTVYYIRALTLIYCRAEIQRPTTDSTGTAM